MKKYLLPILILACTFSNAQTISYKDIGALFSEERINGTARFNAMSGAFGALGGDLSAIDVNPAGAAVYDYSQVAGSLHLNSKSTNARFGGQAIKINNDILSFSQVGGVFVFDENRYSLTNNNKYAFGFNYTRLRDFDNFWVAKSDPSQPTTEQNVITDIFDQNVVYNILDGKQIEVNEDGKNDKYAFTFAAKLENKFHIGASLNIYDVEHYQSILIEEYNSNNAGDTFDTSTIQEQFTRGNGVSIALGMITHPMENLRFGVSYQSPVWYNLAEDFLAYDINTFENSSLLDDKFSGINAFDYKLRTPSRLTGSLAYIFENKGLISADYTYKNYANIQLSDGNFIDDNNLFTSNFDSYSSLRVGGEWRFDKISARAGFHIENSPNDDGFAIDSTEGFSLGLGYSFTGGRLDFAYQYQNFSRRLYDNYSNYQDIIDGLGTGDSPVDFTNFTDPDLNQLSPTSLSFSNARVTTTLVINI